MGDMAFSFFYSPPYFPAGGREEKRLFRLWEIYGVFS